MNESPKTPLIERVLPSKGSFFLPVLLGLGLFAVFYPILGNLSYLVAVPGALLVVWLMWIAAPVISIDDKTLQVGNARIELKHLGKVRAVSSEESFSERGPKLNARAFTKFQPSVKTLVRVEVKDPNDPTPYWLFSSRRGAEIVDRLS